MEASLDHVPQSSYGILLQDQPASELDEIAEQVRRDGYAVVDSGLHQQELEFISAAFDSAYKSYVEHWGEARLRAIDEYYTIRALLTHADNVFLRLASNANLLKLLQSLIVGRFILNQQNGVINPPQAPYNQGAWHRDLPYQHFVSSTPLAVNALFCLDDFTIENGSTFVLPGSHRSVNYPSAEYIRRQARQLQAKAGQFLVLDCMLFHSGGFNRSDRPRRAINHVYTIPYLKQQVKLQGLMKAETLSEAERQLLGFGCEEPASIDQYFASRVR